MELQRQHTHNMFVRTLRGDKGSCERCRCKQLGGSSGIGGGLQVQGQVFDSTASSHFCIFQCLFLFGVIHLLNFPHAYIPLQVVKYVFSKRFYQLLPLYATLCIFCWFLIGPLAYMGNERPRIVTTISVTRVYDGASPQIKNGCPDNLTTRALCVQGNAGDRCTCPVASYCPSKVYNYIHV